VVDHFFNWLRDRYNDCLIDSCKEQGVVLRLGSVTRRSLIIDCNKYKKKFKLEEGSKIGDRIIFVKKGSRELVVISLELEKEVEDLEYCCEQVQRNAEIAERIIKASGFLRDLEN